MLRRTTLSKHGILLISLILLQTPQTSRSARSEDSEVESLESVQRAIGQVASHTWTIFRGGSADPGHHEHHEHPEHPEHPEHKEGHNEGHDGHQHHDHTSIEYSQGDLDDAIGLLSTACLVPMVMFLAMSSGPIAAMTLKLLDVFVSIFLAVLWYSVLEKMLSAIKIADAWIFADDLVVFVVVVLLWAALCSKCYEWRDETTPLVTLGSFGGHFIAFEVIGLCQSTMEHVANWPGNPAPFAMSFVLVAVFESLLQLVFFIHQKVFLEDVEHEKFQEVVEEAQIDITALSLTFCLTLAVRHAAVGTFPEHGHHHHEEPAEGALSLDKIMLGTMGVILIGGSLILPRLHEFLSHAWVHSIKVSTIMEFAWCYLQLFTFWFELYFPREGMFAHELLSIGTTTLALLILVGLHMWEQSGGAWTADGRQTRNVAITGIALTAAWSWEHCYKMAFDIVGDRYHILHGKAKGLVPKLVLAIVIPMFVLPPYLLHIKTRVIENDEAELQAEMAGHGHEHGAHSEKEIPEAEASQVASEAPKAADGKEAVSGTG